MLIRVVALVVVLSTIADARPGEPIVVISTDAAFSTALDDALVPAGMELVTVGELTPPTSAELPATSRALADREHATAMVWLLPSPGGTTLVTYDRGVDRLLVRELPYRSPLSATQAAEAARMVRTMLRALRVTTDSDQLPPPATGGPAVVEPPAPVFGASVALGGWFAAPGRDTSLAATVAVGWRPHQLGAALGATFAPSAPIMTAAFDGRVRDVVIAGEVHTSLAVSDQIRVAPAVGLALHAVQLEGSFGGATLQSRRFDPAIRLAITPAYELPAGLAVGLAVSADCLLRRQRYEAGTEEILVVPRVQVLAGVIVGIRR